MSRLRCDLCPDSSHQQRGRDRTLDGSAIDFAYCARKVQMRELAGPDSLGLSCYAAVTMATAMSATHALPKKTGIPCASHRTRLEHSPTDPRHLMRPRAGEAPTASVAYTAPTRLRMPGWPRAVRVRPDARGVGEVGAQFPDVFEASIDTRRGLLCIRADRRKRGIDLHSAGRAVRPSSRGGSAEAD